MKTGAFVATLLLLLWTGGCSDSSSERHSSPTRREPASVTLTDPETGESRSFSCSGLVTVVQPGDMRFLMPYVKEVVSDAQLKGDTATNMQIHEAMTRGSLDRVAAMVIRYKCQNR